MLEDKDRPTDPLEQDLFTPTIQYRFLRGGFGGQVDHYAYVLYAAEPLKGAELAEARYTNGTPESVCIKYGTKESLLDDYYERMRRRRGFAFGGHGPALYPLHDAVRLVASGDGFDVYDDEVRSLGRIVGEIKPGERFTHPAIPYFLQVSRTGALTTFKRINPKDNSVWEFTIPNQITLNGPEEIPIDFKDSQDTHER